MKQMLWVALAATTLVTTACHEKKQPYNIIVKKEQAAQPTKPQAIGNYVQDYQADWAGADYTIKVDLKADTSLPQVSDGTSKYYDNSVTLTINRADGTQFLQRKFTKDFFAPYVDANYLAKSALVGFVYNKAEANHLVFAVSVGSPDTTSDDVVPFSVKISRTGSISVSRDSSIDTSATDDESIE